MSTMDWNAQGGSGPQTYEEFLVPAMFEPCADVLLERAGVGPGARVLDVACGTGAVSRAAARRAGPEGAVTGVDLGEPMLAVARSYPPEESAAPIEYVQSDAAALPVPEGAFDFALCQHGLQFFPDRVAALSGMRRAVKPGGRLAVATWTDIAGSPFGAVAAALDEHMGGEPSQMIQSPFALSAAELEESIAAAGFSDVRLEQVTLDCTWASQGDFARRAIAAGPIAPLFTAAPEDVQQAVADDTAERLAPHATPDGRLSMPMTTNLALATA
jgi:ubiquinone/menaquinone biosynthesis C-methylase UbiE